MTSLISIDDAEALISLVAAAGDPTVDLPVASRKRLVIEALQRLIDADAWVWTTGTLNLERPGDAMAVNLLDDGWRSADERMAILTAATNPEYTTAVFAGMSEALAAGRMFTISRDQVMEDETWANSRVGQDWRGTGMDHFIVSAYPLQDAGYSAIGMYRRIGKPAFSKRDRLLVHLVCQNVDWLHRDGADVPAAEKVIELSPRERQVMMLLMAGDGRKQVAQKLKLSEHTIGDYLKAIYRKFGVTSRSELLSQFISGN